MTLDELISVADGASVELTVDAIERIAESRRVLDEAIARGEAIYGVTTSVGHARDERLPLADLRAWQPVLVEMHVGAMGPPLPAQRIRAGMAARLNGFARGGAGVSVAVAESLAALLNHRIHPLIPRDGSVGAGDLGQLALVARVLLGRGDVEMDGRQLSAAEALQAADLAPVTLEPKDALALMSSNALSVGYGALLVRRLDRLLTLADLIVATSMQAVHANPSVVESAVASARGSKGQEITSERIRRALSGGSQADAATGLSVQDPLSFRVVPQVHGACRDVLMAAADAVVAELNAASDNPLVDVASRRVLSNGNFHPMNVALAAESLRVALGHVGLLSERRMGHLWDTAVTSLGTPGADATGPPLADGAPPAFAGLGLRYPAAARYTRLRHLAQPVTLDVPPLDLAIEDHASNAAEALTMTEQAAGIVEDLLVVELLIAVTLLGPVVPDRLGTGTRQLVAALHEELGRIPTGTLPGDVHRRVTELLRKRFAGSS
ncbi:aromatic amino acid lyase [Phytoactinopolyspora alkaliphila]|uniref:Aromatic amino acid lyase n=1 Tax=Phytoactinopolyspora alkaliphila TaxID=1783498 RepID=A0A6N9YP46_9ACTN|nr:aromatic amino acid ammonia-lyase [Phytoactinopolyspora alkaliphila]NED96599.1 aromatic amino acid lyase [Phytoactinopolyspora alkaliphila]